MPGEPFSIVPRLFAYYPRTLIAKSRPRRKPETRWRHTILAWRLANTGFGTLLIKWGESSLAGNLDDDILSFDRNDIGLGHVGATN